MCGIFGITALKGMNIKKSVLRQILKNLARNSQSRGRDATGYAFSSKKGINIFKHNIPASAFIELENYKNVVRTALASTDFYSVIGHTRAQTKGAATNPENNHPIQTGSIIGVHNGVIINDDNLFEWLHKITDGDVKRLAQVDSEIIFSLVNYYATKNKFPESIKGVKLVGHVSDPTSRAIIQMSEKISGSFACALIDAQNPKISWIFRGNGPVTIKYFVDEGIVIYASEERFIDKSVSLFNLVSPKNLELESYSGMCINTEDNTFNTFKLKSTINTHRMRNY